MSGWFWVILAMGIDGFLLVTTVMGAVHLVTPPSFRATQTSPRLIIIMGLGNPIAGMVYANRGTVPILMPSVPTTLGSGCALGKMAQHIPSSLTTTNATRIINATGEAIIQPTGLVHHIVWNLQTR